MATRFIKHLGMSVLTAGCMVNAASGLTLDGSGKVLEWGITPFSSVNGQSQLGNLASSIDNNHSPITYPHGLGNIPSPGGATGEKFDLEEMHARVTGATLEVLLVSSSDFAASASGTTYLLGDLLINTDADSAFEYGLILNNHDGLTRGQLYEINTTRGLQKLPGSYWNVPSVASQVGPWGVKTGTLLDTYNFEPSVTHSYAGEANTFIKQFSIDLADLGLDPMASNTLSFQVAWGCGNDVIRLTASFEPENIPGVPEPTTATLGVVSLAGVLLARRRQA